MKQKLYLMRHGQTLFNARRKVQGWCDSPLTELGIAQAKVARSYFTSREIAFDAAYSSPSERASDTLELITDMPYTRHKGLKEWNFGAFEGESEDLNPSLPYGDFFVPYGGEAEHAFRTRVVNTIQDIMKQDNHQHVIMLSHAAACAQFARHFEQHSKVGVAKGLKNCCILVFEVEAEVFSLVELVNHDFASLTDVGK